MSDTIDDIYSEPADIDVHTLDHLGPLAPLAGRFQGLKGVDVNPKADGPVTQAFVETIDLVPCDPQANGPQLLYGLRYHVRVTKPGEVETYHDQVGYWLWEPASGLLMQTLTIPRGQSVLAIGHATRDARRFEVSARRGRTDNGIVSNPFLETNFRTESYRCVIEVHGDGRWSYDEDTVLAVRGQAEPFHHTDCNTLERIAPPEPNPLVRSLAGTPASADRGSR